MAIEYRRIQKLIDTAAYQQIVPGSGFRISVPMYELGAGESAKLVNFSALPILQSQTFISNVFGATLQGIRLTLQDSKVRSGTVLQKLPGQPGYFDFIQIPYSVVWDIGGSSVAWFQDKQEKQYFVSRAPIVPTKGNLIVDYPETSHGINILVELLLRMEPVSELEQVQAIYSGGTT